MMRWTAIALLALAATFATHAALAADHPLDSKRKVVNRVMPFYPQIARTMGLSGVVKIEVLVGNNGNPRLFDVKGGHPMLVQAAVDAVRKWKWEPASHETKEPIEVTFAPDSQ